MKKINYIYLNSLIAYFQKNKNKKKYVSDITKTPVKFIEHVKYYIDIRTREFPDVHFSDDFSILYIND
jgi:hypothetical protein